MEIIWTITIALNAAAIGLSVGLYVSIIDQKMRCKRAIADLTDAKILYEEKLATISTVHNKLTNSVQKISEQITDTDLRVKSLMINSNTKAPKWH